MNKVLIIDDDENILMVLRTALMTLGKYNVVTADSGKAGLKSAKHFSPDVILLDISMPDMDGLTVLKKLRAGRKTRSIPVIMVTGLDDQDLIAEASYLYAEQYLTKPFDFTTLDTTISRVLSARDEMA